MEIQDIINAQYMVLVMADKLETDRDSKSFKDFKHRIFDNIEFLKHVEKDN